MPLNESDWALVEAAREVLRRTYRPPHHTVAAAVRCGSGKIFTGVNVDAAAGYGPCAEPVAIGSAFANGETQVLAIVAVCKRSDELPVLSPCGNCRQLLFDYAPDATVIYCENGTCVKTAARNLLPGAYVRNSVFNGGQ